jgi:hypothetical protein
VKRLLVTCAAVLGCLPVFAAAPAGAAVRRIQTAAPGWMTLPLSSAQLESAEGTLRRTSGFRTTSAYWGGARTASTGETVDVYAADDYPDVTENEAALQSVADFLAGLPHGDELQHVQVYIVTPAEVTADCGDSAAACYGGGILVVPGQWPAGFPGLEVLTHEYGHHIAANRDDSPWDAIDWGPKNWETAMNICGRVAAGTAFPGDEGDHYLMNPGEAWAENYRLAVWGSRTQLSLNVDASFQPTQADLDAVLLDVRSPWTGPTASTVSGTFAAPKPVTKPKAKPKKKPAKKKKHPTTKRHLAAAQTFAPQTYALSTPRDGTFTATVLDGPPGMFVSLVDAKTHAVLSPPNLGVSYTLCGTRSVELVVTSSKSGAFHVAVSAP